MPNDPRISRLLELVSGPLDLRKLERLTRDFQDLAQDRPETAALFVLQNVTDQLASELRGEAVEYSRFQELTADIGKRITDVLQGLQETRSITSELDDLVATMFRNRGMYRSQDG